MQVMPVIDPLAPASGTVLRAYPRRIATRLPLAVALPLLAGLSALLWLGLFRLVTLVL